MITRKEIWVVEVWVISLHHLPVCLLCQSPRWPQRQSDWPCCLFSIYPPFSCTDYLQFPAHKRVFPGAIFNPTTTPCHNTECKAVVSSKTSLESKTKKKRKERKVEDRNKPLVFTLNENEKYMLRFAIWRFSFSLFIYFGQNNRCLTVIWKERRGRMLVEQIISENSWS